MIKANELRIGNLVMYHGEENMPCVLDAQDILNIDSKYMGNDQIHSPIPLSPEWLERAGYKKMSKDVFSHSCGVWLNVKAEGVFYIYGMRSDRYIQFVHELQNCVFVLVGKELTFKPAPAGSGE